MFVRGLNTDIVSNPFKFSVLLGAMPDGATLTSLLRELAPNAEDGVVASDFFHHNN